MSELEDINRTLYDIDARSLLDVWDHTMDTEDGPLGDWSSSVLGPGSGLFSSGGNGHLLDGGNGSLVLKDRLLTDSLPTMSTEEYPKAVKHEHSYSMTNEAGSDGDSIPASPLSLQDDMETECYPCIPMHSASNQHNHSSLLKSTRGHGGLHPVSLLQPPQSELASQNITIKHELGENEDHNINVVDDDECAMGGEANDRGTNIQQFPTSMHMRLNNNNNYNPHVQNNKMVQHSHNNNNSLINNNNNINNNFNNPSVLTTTVNGNTVFLRQEQHTVQLTRPKHPQSLLKQKPVTHTILVTTPTIVPTLAASGPVPTSIITSRNITPISSQVIMSPGVNPSVASATPTPSAAHHLNSKLLFSRLSGGQTAAKLEPLSHPTAVYTSPVTGSPGSSSNCSTDSFKSLPNPFNNSICLSNRAPITTDLISNQPADSSGVLILTDEEKKTLISEGYPIPTKLPLSKAEEKSLKKIRRKIKNKISAQESRRKKKEFVDTLERQVEVASQELDEYKLKCEVLEKENASLQSQLRSLRALVTTSTCQEPQQQQFLQPQLDIKPEPLETMQSPIDGIGLD